MNARLPVDSIKLKTQPVYTDPPIDVSPLAIGKGGDNVFAHGCVCVE